MNTQTFNKIDQILIEHSAFLNAKARLLQHFEASKTSAEPICLAIIGESRSGKSRVLDHVTSQYPQKRREEGMHIPILSISTPSKPTVKGLAEMLLHAMGDPLWNRRGSENEKTERLIVLLAKTETTMLIIDEFQHFYDKSSRKIQHHVSDWLKILVDRTKIALVVAGLPNCTAVISQNEQLSGRFSGAVMMPRFDWENPEQREEFTEIMDTFQDMLPEYEFPLLGSGELAFRFYCASGGLVGYIAKILRKAIWDAISQKRKVITLENLATAFAESVWHNPSLIVVNPFSDKFDSNASQYLLQLAREIGTAEIGDESPSRGRSRKAPQITSAEAMKK